MAMTLRHAFKDNPVLSGAVGAALSCTRASLDTMQDADGWLRTVQNNEAAFPGASFRHNLVTTSNDLSVGTMTKEGVTVAQDATDSDGNANTAWTVTADNGGVKESCGIRVDQFTGWEEVGHTFTYSCEVKAADATWVLLRDPMSSQSVWFDLSSGTIGTQQANNLDASITDLGGGWYRISATHRPSSGNAPRMYVRAADADNDPQWTNTSVQDLFYLSRLQAEDQSGAWVSENIVPQSNQFDTTWIKTNSVVSSGETDPNGGTDAWKLNDDSGGLGPRQVLVDTPSFGSFVAGRYIASVYAKADQLDWLAIQFHDYGSGNSTSYFDLTNGVVGATNTALSHGIQDVGNGWYRCWAIQDISSEDLTGRLRISVAEANADVNVDDDGTSSILLYRAQLERCKPNQTTPGTYTETAASAVTNYEPTAYIATTSVARSILNGVNDGMQVYESRQNLLLQSEDFSTTWTVTGTTVNVNQTLAPDGSLTADQIDNTTAGDGFKYVSQSVTVATSTEYCLSVFARADQGSWFYMRLSNFTTPAESDVWFDLDSGAVGTQEAGFNASGIEDIGSGWYRCWATFTTDAADTAGTIRFALADADADNTVTDGGDNRIFLWGAVLEQGSKPSPYIRTEGTAVTRNDTDTSVDDVSWHNGDAGSWYCHFGHQYTIDEEAIAGYFLDVAASTINYHRFRLDQTGSRTGELGYQIRNSAAHIGVATPQWAVSALSEGRFSSGWSQTDDEIAVSVDGNSVSTTATTTTSPAPSRITVGAAHGFTGHFNGLIKEIRYYDERLPNATLEAMSNGIFPGGKPPGMGLGFGKMGRMGL